MTYLLGIKYNFCKTVVYIARRSVDFRTILHALKVSVLEVVLSTIKAACADSRITKLTVGNITVPSGA